MHLMVLSVRLSMESLAFLASRRGKLTNRSYCFLGINFQNI